MAWDGTGLSAPDTTANGALFGRRTGPYGPAGYLLVGLTAVVECGTRALIDVVFDPIMHSRVSPRAKRSARIRGGSSVRIGVCAGLIRG